MAWFIGVCVYTHSCISVDRLNLFWRNYLCMNSSGMPSASLRFGLSKVEKFLSFIGNFRASDRLLLTQRLCLFNSGIESVIKAWTTLLFAYFSQWYFPCLLDLFAAWVAQLLNLLRIKRDTGSWHQVWERLKSEQKSQGQQLAICPISTTGQVVLKRHII